MQVECEHVPDFGIVVLGLWHPCLKCGRNSGVNYDPNRKPWEYDALLRKNPPHSKIEFPISVDDYLEGCDYEPSPEKRTPERKA